MNVVFEGKKVHYRTNLSAGDETRPVVVYLHGAGGTGTHWLGIYKATRERLANIVIDLPGHGASEGPGFATIAEYADWLRRFLLALPVDPASVVVAGHSMGGAIALEYALAGNPLAGLFLVATGARLRVSPMIFEALRGSQEHWVAAGSSFFYPATMDPASRELARRELANIPAQVFIQDFEAANQWDALKRVANIDVPALVLCGDNDQMTPVKYSEYLAAQIARASLTILPGMGHMVMMEAPDEVSQALLAFVECLPVPDRRSISTGSGPRPANSTANP